MQPFVRAVAILAVAACAHPACADGKVSAGIVFANNPQTGGMTNLCVGTDPYGMNFVHPANGKDFPSSLGPRFRWGLGSVKVDGRPCAWERPASVEGGRLIYRPTEGLEVRVERKLDENDLVERYEFANVSERTLSLSEIDVYTTFNDNYRPKAELRTRRCHAHVWAGENAGWVAAMRIGGRAPHLGLMATEGRIAAYELKERDLKKGGSDTRGVICLSPPDAVLKPGEATAVGWRIFVHDGWDGFKAGILARGGVWAEASTYVVSRGETSRIVFEARDAALFGEVSASADGKDLPVTRNGAKCVVEYAYVRDGAVRVEFRYGSGKMTHVEILGVADERALVDARVRYILKHQIYHAPGEPQDGAFLPYDPETDTLVQAWRQPNAGKSFWANWSEGRERLGMGVFLARYAQLGPKEKELVLPALLAYARFVQTGLIDADGILWGSTARPWRYRRFDLPWGAIFFAEMFRVTGDVAYAKEAWRQQRNAYRDLGTHRLVASSEKDVAFAVRGAGLGREFEELVSLYRTHKDAILQAGGLNTWEVGTSPEGCGGILMQFLQSGELVGEPAYGKYALSTLLPEFEACLGRQPAWCSHDIGLHHWDGFWFGKLKMWGDTLPQDWNGTAAEAFREVARATGDRRYAARARAIVRQTLGLFEPDGRAHCVFICPDRVDGKPGKVFDPLMNDQDWALAFYLAIVRLAQF